MPDLEQRVRVVLVVLQEVEHAEAQHVKREAYVAMIVEPVQHLNTYAGREGEREEREHVKGSVTENRGMENRGMETGAWDDMQRHTCTC